MFCGYTYTHKAGAEAGGDGSVGEMLAMPKCENLTWASQNPSKTGTIVGASVIPELPK